MRAKRQTYYGKSVRLRETEDFCISFSSHVANSRSRFHSHEKSYLCLLINGSYDERNFRDSFTVSSGMALFRAADYEHSNIFYDEGGTCLNIELNNPDEFFSDSDFSLPTSVYSRAGTIENYVLFHSLKNGSPDDLINILCYESVTTHFDLVPLRGKLDWIRRMKERIHDDPFSPISLNRLSKEFDLHPNYIVRKFKNITGYRLSEYLNRVRIELSLEKMLNTDESLTNIAVETGFCDQSHFIRTFKRYLEASPKEFRKATKRLVSSNFPFGN